ncbi:MAG: ferredoxin, partial [Candidatus Marinimicrobia bacterium]|nr:ferredoxin [Candidatus Neomarinimicrobiota bacterium]
CPEGSVRHDSEEILEIIKTNVEYTIKCMNLCAEYLGDIEEKGKCLKRMKKHFNNERIIPEITLEELEKLYNV